MKSEVFNIDCMIGMEDTPDNYYDLAVVDTEYGINVNMNAGKKRGERDRYENKKWDKKPPDKSYFIELKRVSKHQIIWGCNYFNGLLWSSGRISWFKDNGANNDFSDCELAMHTFNQRVTNVKIQWSGFIRPKEEMGIKRIHPTQKPIKLYEWIFKNYAKEGMKILDTHLGSGSSRIAAYNYKMDFTGYEIDKDYFEAAEKRFQNHIAQLKIFN